MKRYLLLLIPVLLVILNGCTKDAKTNPIPPDIPLISVTSISYPSFVNSTWNNVIGGTVLLEFDLLNPNDSVASKIKDSTDLKNISVYNKVLTKGIYNIYVSSKNQASIADTFIRFNAQLKSYSVSTKQAVSLTATTNDGLITIGQSFIQANTVPVFKPDSGGTTYKLGLINGFYYLYVKGGTKGTISFVTTTNQTITKSLTITALNQYNLAVQTQNGALQVIFTAFTYNQVAVSSSTLLTLNISASAYSVYSSVYFVVTDESGNILNEVKYVPGTSTFKISALQPYAKTRFNFFEVYIPSDVNTVPGILGFLQVKKGSTFTSNLPNLPQKPANPITLHLKNTSNFDQLNISTDIGANTISSVADTTSLQGFSYSNGGKLWVQMLENNKYSYNFFNIASGTTNFNVDLSQLTETPLTKSISAPGNNLQVQVFAKADTNYSNDYFFGGTSSQYNQLDYVYPSEAFEEYDALMYYSIGNLDYTIITAGPTIPAQAATFNASFNITTLTLANFVPSYTGTFDYYHANFQNVVSTPYLDVDLYSPSAANYTNIILPDFSKYLGVNSVDLSKLALKFFGLYQVNGFNEKNFFYPSFRNINSKTVYQNY